MIGTDDERVREIHVNGPRVVAAIEKGAFGSPSTMVANFTLTYV